MDLILQTVLNSPGSIAFDSASRIRTDQTSLLLFAAGEVALTYHNAHILSSATSCALGFIGFSSNRREMPPYTPDISPTGVKLFIHSDVNISITQNLPVVNTLSIIFFHFSNFYFILLTKDFHPTPLHFSSFYSMFSSFSTFSSTTAQNSPPRLPRRESMRFFATLPDDPACDLDF